MDTYDSQAMYKRHVNIYLEANPNPNSLKFVMNFMLMPEGDSRDFPDVASTGNAPLAKALFERYAFVKRVFYMSNFVTITKEEAINWQEVQAEIKDFLQEYLEADKPVLLEEEAEEQQQPANDESELDLKIKSVLEEYIKPAVEQDGGHISYQSFDAGVVKVLLQGSCSGCPSSTVTLKAGIENLLKRLVPEVETVEAIEG